MILVDSSVWIAHLRKLDTPEVRFLSKLDDEVLLGDLVLTEVLLGARDDATAARIEAELRQFEYVSVLDNEIAVMAAANYRKLRRLGFTIRGTIDLLIGTFCMRHRHALLHADRDFDPMAWHLGLDVAVSSPR